MRLLKICNTWTDIALSTPALWARIEFYLPCPTSFQQLLKLWFQRAGGQPLHVSVIGLMDDDVASVIWEHSSRLQHLELSPGEDDGTESGDDDDSDPDIEYWDISGSVSFQPLPLLRSLSIFGRENLTLKALPFLQLLRLSPNLSELTVTDVELDDDADVASEAVVLPDLRRLISDYEMRADITDEYPLLTFISAPRLQSLRLSVAGTSIDDWRIFLDRSKPPLQELIIKDVDTEDADELSGLLALVPTLTRLELPYPKSSLVEDLLSRLAETPCHILPSLQALEIRCFLLQFSTFPWETTLRLLATRRNQLRTFRIVCHSDDVQVPTNILAAFRELTVEGMDIQLGKPNQNLLFSE